jgi:hypothetical protein
MRRLWYELLACGLAAAALIAVITSPASGKAASDDVNIVVYLGTDLTQTKTSGLSFRVSVGVFSGTGVPQAVIVRIALPAGLAWGRDAPDPTEGCVGDAPAVCKQTMTVNQAGTVGFGWIWDVVAAAPGFYEVTASVETEQPDPDLSNNTHTFRFEVVQPTPPPSPPPQPVTVRASQVRFTPAKPKAGSLVSATVRVSANGTPVAPTRLTCLGSIGGLRLAGTPRPRIGVATCLYRPAKTAKGKTLRGTITFRAKGQKITRRFSTKLG